MNNYQNLIPTDVLDSGGRCGKEKGTVIQYLVKKTNAKLCVEIGVFKGSSLMYFIDPLSKTKGKVIGIDPYSLLNFVNHIPDKAVNDLIYNKLFKDQEVLDALYLNLVNTLKENNFEDIATIVRDTSENQSSNFETESIDLLHIDGNHDEEFVTKDILLYLPLVKRGGYIIMDDITWEGVIQSINKHLVTACDLIESRADFAVYRKK